MNIVHISQSDNQGGAAIAALRLHNAMLKLGIDSILFVLRRNIKDREDIISVPRFKVGFSLLLNVLERMLRKSMSGVLGLFSSFLFGFDIKKSQCIKAADIIYLHWINRFINFSALKKICRTGKPVFWFMHDMFAITGGCHHSFECTQYQKLCQKCPYHVKKSVLPDLSALQYRKKMKIYRRFNNLCFIAPSKWLFECAKTSNLTKNKKIFHIPNLIDDTVFKPVDKNAAYLLFSLDKEKKYIGFGAQSALTNPYKGWQYLKSTLSLLLKDEDLKTTAIELIIFGSSYNQEIANSIPCKTHFLGHLADEPSMVMVYNALDVYVIPSIAENFPNTILESLACNTPVVGFDVGGIPDTVNDATGYLARYKDSEDLARGIAAVLRKPPGNPRVYAECFLPDTILSKHKAIWPE